ncbi:MAG TPA: GNAT family N-acetyltransferase [Rhizomicrobium sp.]
MRDVTIRPVLKSDLPALLDIYNYYVVNTPVTFDLEPRTLAQRQEWLDGFKSTGRYRCFVAARGDLPIGWTCSGKFREKAAYDTTVEMSVYLAADAHGQGLGRRLYQTIIEALQGEDINRLYGGITLPNAASVALHVGLGFQLKGIQSEIGRKFGKFWDVALYLKAMG